MAILRAYDKVINLIAGVTSPNRLMSLRLSIPARIRMVELIGREERGKLTSEEALELELYLELEQTFAHMRARARQQLYGAGVGAA